MATTPVFDFILQLLANPALAQSFLSDPDGTLDGIDLNQTDITVMAAEINNAAELLNSSGVGGIAIPAIVPGLTAGALLDGFVTGFYADHPTTSNVWTDGPVTQAFAGEGAVSVAAGEEFEDDVTIATGGSVAVDDNVEDSGIALGGGIAAGEDVEIEDNDDVTVGDGNVQVVGANNDVVGGDQVNNLGSPGSNIATGGSTIQDADDGGMNAGVNAVDESNIVGDDLALGAGAIASDGNVATGPDAVATDGPVADGSYNQAAGEDSNLVKDDDVIATTVGAQSAGRVNYGDQIVTHDDNDALSSGNQSGAAAEDSVIAGGVSIVSQDNDAQVISYGNDVEGGVSGDASGAGVAGAVSGGATGGSVNSAGAFTQTNDTNSAVGIANVAADDASVAAGVGGAAAGYAGDAQAGTLGAQLANDDSSNAGVNGVHGEEGVAAGDGNIIAYSNDGDAAVGTGESNIAQGDGIVAGEDAYGEDAVVIYSDSFNEDSNITHGDLSPVFSADDESEIEEIEIENEIEIDNGFPII